MLRSLSARLFITYLVLIAVTLGVTVAALAVLLNLRPAPPQQTYQRLAAVAQGIPYGELLAASNIGILASPQQRFRAVTRELGELAEELNVRILVVNTGVGSVVYDSAGVYTNAEIELNREPYTIPAAIRRGFSSRVDAIFGNFNDPSGDEWLFVGLETRGAFTARPAAILFADPHETQTLQDVLGEFGPALFIPVCQSALVGIAIAVVLAVFGSRSVTRHLQTLARASSRVAAGQYGEPVPVRGAQEVQALAEAFNNMTAQVQATQKAQQDFLANVSHDLKTPLTSIQGYSQAIIDGAAADPVHAARVINEEATRLNRMVMQLTDLARLEAGSLPMRWSAIDVSQITAAVGERLAIVAREKGVQLHVDAAPVPEIRGDGDRLVQVLTNLLSNAINYTPAGGSVHVATRPGSGGVEVVVRDTGIGIPPDELPRIFERFYQVDKARGPERGTGLGLAIVQELVQAHGGRVNVASAGSGRGATFTIWFPRLNGAQRVRR